MYITLSAVGKSPRMKYKQRSKSVWGGGSRPPSVDAKSQTMNYLSRSSALPQSRSNPLDITRVSPNNGGMEYSFSMLPQEVLIASVWDQGHSPSRASWNIQLMTEEEVGERGERRREGGRGRGRGRERGREREGERESEGEKKRERGREKKRK